MTDERHQQLVFSLGEGDDGTAPGDAFGVRIHIQIASSIHGGSGGRRLRMAQGHFDPGNQFFHFKWFGDIVVGAPGQPGHLIADVIARRQHDDRHLAGFANAAQHTEAVQVRQHPVQND